MWQLAEVDNNIIEIRPTGIHNSYATQKNPKDEI